MGDFPAVVKNRRNRIAASSQFTSNVEGYLFDGVDGSQVAFWISHEDRISEEHTHDFDEYVLLVEGQAAVTLTGRKVSLAKGDELVIPQGTSHRMESTGGTRTIHVFGGQRARRT